MRITFNIVLSTSVAANSIRTLFPVHSTRPTNFHSTSNVAPRMAPSFVFLFLSLTTPCAGTITRFLHFFLACRFFFFPLFKNHLIFTKFHPCFKTFMLKFIKFHQISSFFFLKSPNGSKKEESRRSRPPRAGLVVTNTEESTANPIRMERTARRHIINAESAANLVERREAIVARTDTSREARTTPPNHHKRTDIPVRTVVRRMESAVADNITSQSLESKRSPQRPRLRPYPPTRGPTL